MKKIITLFLYLFVFNLVVIGQTTSFKNGEIENIVESSMKKEQLFINCKFWIDDCFSNYKYVVNYEDKEAGIISLSSKALIYSSTTTILDVIIRNTEYLSFDIVVECKDNKYRYTLKNFKLQLVYGEAGSEMDERPISDRPKEIELEKTKAEQIKKELSLLKVSDKSELSKRERKNIELEIEKKESELTGELGLIKTYQSYLEKENEVIQYIQDSLINAMAKNRNF